MYHAFYRGAKNKAMLIYVYLVTSGVTLESLEISPPRSVTTHFPLPGRKLNEYKSFKAIIARKLSFSWSNRGVSNLKQRRPLRLRIDQLKNKIGPYYSMGLSGTYEKSSDCFEISPTCTPELPALIFLR